MLSLIDNRELAARVELRSAGDFADEIAEQGANA